MGALTSLATVLGAGATIYGQVRQAQAQSASSKAQAHLDAAQLAAQRQVALAQAQEAALQRQITLARTVASARARLAAAGVSPDDGSAAAVTGGLAGEAAAAQGADDATLRARLASGRSSLLNPDGTVTALLRSGRGFGAIAKTLLD
jgi:multidrug resistance efflux pump